MVFRRVSGIKECMKRGSLFCVYVYGIDIDKWFMYSGMVLYFYFNGN